MTTQSTDELVKRHWWANEVFQREDGVIVRWKRGVAISSKHEEAFVRVYLAEDYERLQRERDDRDRDWILAMGHALGLDSGFMVPVVPKVEPFKELFAAIRERELAARDKTIEALVLDADARIGSTIFRKGVPWATVIKRAQREFEYQQNPVKPMTDAERDAFWKAMEPDAARSEGEKPI